MNMKTNQITQRGCGKHFQTQKEVFEFIKNNFEGKLLNLLLQSITFLATKSMRVLKIIDPNSFSFIINAVNLNGILFEINIYTNEAKQIYENEVKCNKSISSDNVQKFLGNCEDTINKLFFTLFELLPNDLENYLQQNEQLSERLIKQIFSDILQGIIDLHQQSIIHCDINPMHVKFTNQRRAKLCCLNLATNYSDLECKGKTFNYCSPEQIIGKVTIQSDYYSAGVLLLRMCDKVLNLEEINQIKQKPESYQIDNDPLKVLKQISISMIKQDPTLRATPESILKRLKTYDQPSLNNQHTTEIDHFSLNSIQTVKSIVCKQFEPEKRVKEIVKLNIVKQTATQELSRSKSQQIQILNRNHDSNRTINADQQSNQAYQKQIQLLNSAIQQQKNKILILEQKNQKLQEELAQSNALSSRSNQRISELESKQAQLQDLRNKPPKNSQEDQRLQNIINELESRLELLNKILSQKDKEIFNLKQQNTSLIQLDCEMNIHKSSIVEKSNFQYKELLDFFIPQGMKEEQIKIGVNFIEIKRYTLNKKLGQGKYGFVFLAKDEKNNREVAIKFIYAKDETITNECKLEANNLKKLNCNNIIKIYDFFSKEESGFFFFVTELCEQGTLQEYVDLGHNYGEDFIRKVIIGLMNGLIALHNANLVHSDLKLDNVLLSLKDGIKICDLGLSVFIEVHQSKVDQKGCNIQNCAPGQLNDKVGKQSDVFSCGIILVQLLFPKLTIGQLSTLKSNNQISLHDKFPHLSKLAELMTKHVAKERLTPKEVIQKIEMNTIINNVGQGKTKENVDFQNLFLKVNKMSQSK